MTTATAHLPTPAVTRPPRAWKQARLVAGRNLQHIKTDPEQLVNMTVFPIMFLLLFVYVFGGAIASSSREYLQYALPGILVSSVGITSMQTGVSLAIDFRRGIVDRFRSLPIGRSAVITGRITADAVRMVWGTLMILGFGMLLGFRPSSTLAGVVGAVVLVAAFGVVLSWAMALLGVASSSVEGVNNLSFLIVLPLTFMSSVYTSPETMPSVLGAFAAANPITHVADAARALLLGQPMGNSLTLAIVWMVVITAITAPLAVRKYHRRV